MRDALTWIITSAKHRAHTAPAFHNFKRFDLPYAQQRIPGLEFAEVASMSTELLSSPFITTANGGFYSPPDADKFLKTHLERILTFWPYMAVVDAFQHWVYTHHEEASSPDNCDSKWHQLWKRYIPGVDWSGLKHSAETGWHRKPHIFRYPFYYIEYGLAQLGAVQVWRNAQEDPERSLNQFKGALCLGGTASLPDLYKTAGAKFAFDSQTLEDAVRFIENEIKKLAQ
jgi:oligoendopeptidase F